MISVFILMIFQFLRGIRSGKCVDHGIDIAGEKALHIINCKSNAMVRDPALGIIVRADPLASISGAHLRSPFAGDFVILLPRLEIVQLCRKQLHCLVAVFELAPLILTFDHDSGRLVQKTDCRFRFVDMLTARAARFDRFDLQIRR